MTHEETRKRILSDESFVLSECQKLRTLFGLKHVIRYDMSRVESVDTESVAEHVYGMFVLAAYFLPLEDLSESWDRTKIYQLMQLHDIDEIVTGDFLGFTKTDEQVAKGRAAVPQVIAQLPESMKPFVSQTMLEYAAQKTNEAKFAKAIDKIEPSFHIFCENGKRINHEITKVTYAQHRSIKDTYTKPFPVIDRVNDVLSRHLRDNNFFAN